MGKSSEQSAIGASSFRQRDSRPNYILGSISLVVGILLLISIVSYRADQNPLFTTTVSSEKNLVGMLGVKLAYWSLKLTGITAWIIWLYFVWLSYMYYFGHAHRLRIWRLMSSGLAFLCMTILLTLLETNILGRNFIDNYTPHGIGGAIGELFYKHYLDENIGMGGTAVVFGILLVANIIYVTYDNVGRNLRGNDSIIAGWWKARKAAAKAREEEAQRLAAEARKAEVSKPKAKEAPAARGITRKGSPEDEPKPISTRKAILEEPEPPIDGASPVQSETDAAEDSPVRKKGSRAPFKVEPIVEDTSPSGEILEADAPPDPAAPPVAPIPSKGLKIIAVESVKKAAAPVREKSGSYVFPPMAMLMNPEPVPLDASEDAHQATAEAIVRTLGEFGVKVTMGEVHTGPVITRYDVFPAAGVRVEKIANLDKNLALSLKATSVRILAPVPGRGCVGIEVPNRKAQPVCIRDIIESEDWVNYKGEIPIALGKEVSGRPLIADLTKMPHLLIAGSTGAGKTVCINAIVTSLLYRHSPEDLRFVMVDPKIVEMQVYNALPHMLIPVVTDPKKVPGALKYLLNEMEHRYQMFASIGVRNIAGYNAKMGTKKDDEAEAKARAMDAAMSPEERAAMSTITVPRDATVELPKKIPYIVVIIDELADLMMVAPADIETGIARLAQLARAAGIHLLIATQRPSVNVITGIIKANLPSRIAFKVAAKVDSRTILDTMGADQLIGRGDMLFLPPGSSDLIRAQGAYVADEEINAIVDFLKQNGEPTFDEVFQRSVEESVDLDEEGAGEEEEDLGADTALINQSLDVLRSTGRASTSMLQRKLRIGYNRAARIMEVLEDKGVVGPDNGAQPREILRDLEGLKF
ncbi:MAG: DNA translocase FtsK [Verrucomicrobiota bacterium]|nr:DNA translocase FtsK [Verrucomicrobiota bacterium]